MPTARADIDHFLAHHRIAVVGVSRDPKHFSRYLYKELCDRGYDAVPVNPEAAEVDGHACFKNVRAINPPVEAALVLTPASETANVVHDCADAGLQEVWMHRGGGQGSVNPEAVAFCREHGMRLVEGECPFMFLPNTQWFHRAHGAIKKMLRAYPA